VGGTPTATGNYFSGRRFIDKPATAFTLTVKADPTPRTFTYYVTRDPQSKTRITATLVDAEGKTLQGQKIYELVCGRGGYEEVSVPFSGPAGSILKVNFIHINDNGYIYIIGAKVTTP